MILEALITILIIWNIILTYYLFKYYFVEFCDLKHVVINHLMGLSIDEIIAGGQEGKRTVCKKRVRKMRV